MTAGAAFIAGLRPDPRKLRQSRYAVRTGAFALFNQIVMQLAVSVDLAALRPGLLQQLGLAPVLLPPCAQRCLSHAWNPLGWMRRQRHIARTEN